MQDQVWWVTGASSGIGAALAKGLAARGARLILSGRNIAALEAVAREIGPGTMILPFEATDYAALPTLVDEAWDWCGRIDGLVNNAGISQRSLAVDTDFAVYQKIVDVDLLAPIALTQQLLPRMIADSVRAENEHLGLKVLVVAPGSVATNVSRNALNADGSVRGESDAAIENGLSPDFAAENILDAVEAGTRELVVAGGSETAVAELRRSNPDALFDRMSAMVQAGYAQQMKATSAS